MIYNNIGERCKNKIRYYEIVSPYCNVEYGSYKPLFIKISPRKGGPYLYYKGTCYRTDIKNLLGNNDIIGNLLVTKAYNPI